MINTTVALIPVFIDEPRLTAAISTSIIVTIRAIIIYKIISANFRATGKSVAIGMVIAA